MKQIKFTVENESDANKRLDVYVCEQDETLSRNYVKKLADDGKITVNEVAKKASYSTKMGDVVSSFIEEPVEIDMKPENIEIEILFEDNDLIVVNKAKGMVVHPAAGNFSGTLVNALLYHCNGTLSGINGSLRPGIVHRIDKDTSGVLVVAKTDVAHKSLSGQLFDHSMTRVYDAITVGVIKEDGGTIDAPIGRHTVDRIKMGINRRNGKKAVTHYKVIERLIGHTHIQARLETGRTHQIRVHMASLGRPLLGDSTYGAKTSKLVDHGQSLHASILGFVHPVTGEYMEFFAPLPAYFVELLDKLKQI